MSTEVEPIKNDTKAPLENGLTDLSVALGFSQDFGVQLSQTATLIKNNRNYFLSNDRTTLTYGYTTHGLIQTLIDQPVEDAFRGGIEISSDELDAENINELQHYLQRNDTLEHIKEAWKWARLYGGGALVINTIGKANKPLNINQIDKHSFLEFYAADLWELHKTNSQPYAEKKPYVKTGIDDEFFFYSNQLDKSRVILTKGKRAPSFARAQLRGWGMSEVERLVRSLNQYLKNQDLIFELLDEAKIDVYGINNLNVDSMSPEGIKALQTRMQAVNQMKSTMDAIVTDNLDKYEQKQMNFAGLSEMLQQIRIGVASDLKMPLTKLFGESSAGFNSGEDGLENYNAMIESEIRGKADNMIIQVLEIISQKLFGFVPGDIKIKYKALRMLSAEQEENVKTSKINYTLSMYDRGLMTSEEVINEVNQQEIFTTKIDNAESDFPIPPARKPNLDLNTGAAGE
jgi:phage-related protein (TIGR01555 family)